MSDYLEIPVTFVSISPWWKFWDRRTNAMVGADWVTETINSQYVSRQRVEVAISMEAESVANGDTHEPSKELWQLLA